ncbi:lipase family protein [Xanthomonas tesorieronis]|uniref:lipase family protein n=1 Tax=Xanthomonas tesorieronis TaxID=3160839 RepID=UPI0035164EE5
MQYDQYQTVFALSSLANWVSKRFGKTEHLQIDYQKTIQATLASSPAQAVIGSWELAWGPQVWQKEGTFRSGNAMFVAKTSTLGELVGEVYVVAIAATDPFSRYDWVTEDFDVTSVVDFLTYDPTVSAPPVALTQPSDANTAISMGTAIGVWHLLNMVSPLSAVSPGNTLTAFLKTLPSGANVIFAGHSLGGALSPTMATWLKSNNKLEGCNAVYCYPTAGATSGNATFSDLCNSTLPPTTGDGYKVWNRDLWNSLDVVPHAWKAAMLEQIKTLYENEEIPVISKNVSKAESNAASSGVTYTQIPNQELPGTLQGVPKNAFEFILQAAKQHTTAYSSLIAHKLNPVPPQLHELLTTELDQDAELYGLLAWLEAEARAAT